MEKLPSFVLSRNATTPYYPISLSSLSRVRLREVKDKRQFQTYSSIGGRVRLREMVANKRFQR